MNIKVIIILPHGKSTKTSKTETDQQVVSPSTPLDGKNNRILGSWFCLYQLHYVISHEDVWMLESQWDLVVLATPVVRLNWILLRSERTAGGC